jgi:hypothetical protein
MKTASDLENSKAAFSPLYSRNTAKAPTASSASTPKKLVAT